MIYMEELDFEVDLGTDPGDKILEANSRSWLNIPNPHLRNPHQRAAYFVASGQGRKGFRGLGFVSMA